MSCINGDHAKVNPQLKQLYGENGTVVTSIEGLLTDAESQYLLDRADGLFTRSTVTADDGGNRLDEARTSSSAFLPKSDDEIISCIENRIATYALHPVKHLEPLQVTDYTNKQQYTYHHDYFDCKDGKPDRTTTVFSYLKSEGLEDGLCGGATAFGKLKDADGNELKVYPKRGNAVMWSNRTFTGNVNSDTLHSGEAVACANAHKTGLNAWFRDSPW